MGREFRRPKSDHVHPASSCCIFVLLPCSLVAALQTVVMNDPNLQQRTPVRHGFGSALSSRNSWQEVMGVLMGYALHKATSNISF